MVALLGMVVHVLFVYAVSIARQPGHRRVVVVVYVFEWALKYERPAMAWTGEVAEVAPPLLLVTGVAPVLKGAVRDWRCFGEGARALRVLKCTMIAVLLGS